jgi:hypothetical protein
MTSRAITDADFPSGATSVAFVDATFLVNRVAVPAALLHLGGEDGRSWDALDFSSKEGAPDPIIDIKTNYRDVYLIGSRTTEIWIDTGALDFPFERRDFVEYGVGAPASILKLGGTLIGIAQDSDGRGIVGLLHRTTRTGGLERLGGAQAESLDRPLAGGSVGLQRQRQVFLLHHRAGTGDNAGARHEHRPLA